LQWSQEMSGAVRVIVSMVYLSLFAGVSMVTIPLAGI
jgi:hypothetical protein